MRSEALFKSLFKKHLMFLVEPLPHLSGKMEMRGSLTARQSWSFVLGEDEDPGGECRADVVWEALKDHIPGKGIPRRPS